VERKAIEEAQAALAADRNVSARRHKGAGLNGPSDEITMLREQIAGSRNLLTQASAEIARLNAERDALAAWGAQQEAIIVMVLAQLGAAQVEATRWQEACRRMEKLQPTEANQATVEPDGQFRRLRALIVKELHPDHAPADSVDRALRAEVFKAIWPKIEALADRCRHKFAQRQRAKLRNGPVPDQPCKPLRHLARCAPWEATNRGVQERS
jgi:hypothetical protein